MLTTKKAIAVQQLRTKLGDRLVEPGEEFEDLIDRIELLIGVGAATAIDQAGPAHPPVEPVQEPSQSLINEPPGASNVDALLGSGITAPVSQGSRRRSSGQRGAEV